MFSGRIYCLRQLRPVMVLPHLGQSDPLPERQVVPQWEQVLAVAAQAFLVVPHPPLPVQPQV